MFALLAALIAASPGPAFIENDYPRALARAKASKKLLFVDAWAKWCHSCVYMREHVMNQPAFKTFEKDVVFASIDTEEAQAAPFLERYPVNVYPTLFFIDPATETIRFRWAGSADAEQMAALLSAAKRQDAKVAEADEAFAQGDSKAAAAKFMTARKDGDESTRAAMSLVMALSQGHEAQTCVTVANDEAPKAKSRSDQLFLVMNGLGCANDLPEGPKKPAQVAALSKQTKELIANRGGLMADDVSSAYELLVDERSNAKDDAGAEALGKEWQSYLDEVAGQAKTPAARAAFDAHRVLAALAAKTPEHMVAPLLQSEKELSTDYNPAARLSTLYRELGKLDEAKAAIARALKKCRGPRKLGLYAGQAKIFAKAGDAAGQKKSLEQGLTYAKTLPKVQRPARMVASLEEQLRTL